MSDNVSVKFKTEGVSTTGEILLGSNQVKEVMQALVNEFDLKIIELLQTCKSRSDTIIEYSNKIAELEEVLTLVKKDLLMRAEEDSNGCKVVDLSSSIWINLTEALKE